MSMEKIKDLRNFLDAIKNLAEDEMLEINEVVDPRAYEINTFLEILRQQGKFPLLKFNTVKAFSGEIFPGSLVTSADPGSYRRAAVAFDLPLKESHTQDVIEELGRRANNPIKPVAITREMAPVKEQVFLGEDANLDMLPLVMHFAEDAKPGWFTPVVAFRHPESGRYNLSFNRCLYHGPRRITVKITPKHQTHAAQYYNRAEELGEKVPFVCILGHHPGFYQGSAISTPYSMDEYDQVGGIMGQPLRVVPSETWGDKFMVPADAEIIIEGEMIPGEYDNEGPFGEWPAYYGPQLIQPVGHIKAITMRKNPIFQAIWASHHMLEDIAHSVGLQAWIKTKFPRLVSACSLYHTWAIISIDKRIEGEPIRVAMQALAYGVHVKHVVIVDKDINPFDLREVFWAISMRVQPEDSVQVIRNIKLGKNDPSLIHSSMGSAMIIDATEPTDRPFQTRVAVPEETLVRLKKDLDKYIDPAGLEKIPVRDRWVF